MTSDNINSSLNNIIHNILQYVDDSTNTNNNNINEMQQYINKHYKVLEGYYNLNKFQINADKSKLLIICKPVYCQYIRNVVLQANQYLITQSTKIKVLGIFITAGLSNYATVNNIISKVNIRLNILRDIFRYSNFRTKLILTYSVIISVIKYAAPILINSNKNITSKLQMLIMK